MIQVALGALADYAADTGLGKLTLVGVFDQINAPLTDGPIALPEATLAFIATASVVDGFSNSCISLKSPEVVSRPHGRRRFGFPEESLNGVVQHQRFQKRDQSHG